MDRHSSAGDKIALFCSLFRGRDDVFARRFENRRTGRSGYAPACANEWVRGVCEKPRVKCAECPHHAFLPVTDEVVRWHLSGADDRGLEFVMGLYPMLRDERCHLIATDLDGDGWQDDARALRDSCRRLGLPVLLERSRSGNGAHLWMFFDRPVPAALARRVACHLLTETHERRPEIGFASYDRLFPNQDTLPRGGFGNLIALPLQHRPRAAGHTLFLDDDLTPHPDPWAALAAVQKIPRARVEEIAGDAERRGRVVGVRLVVPDDDEAAPWAAAPSRRPRDDPPAGPLPARIGLVLGNQIHLPDHDLPPALRARLLRLAAFQNPEFFRAQAMRLPTFGKPRVISCAELHPHHLALPRGCLEELLGMLGRLKIKPLVRDERCGGVSLEVEFRGALRPDQEAAAAAMLAHDTGVLAATTAFGKTVLAAWLIAKRGVNTLVVVHRQQLLDQWVERLATFLGLAPKQIGRLGGGRRRLTGGIDVALMQSLVRRGVVDDRVGDYGHLVIDECHHVPAFGFECVARRAKARFITGLSATVTRKDGHHPIIFMQCGPVRFRVDARQQAAVRPFAHMVVVRPTGFHSARDPEADPRLEFGRLCVELTGSADRNRLICDDTVAAVAEGRTPLVLTERTAHLDELAGQLRARVAHVVVLQGGMGRKKLDAELARLAAAPPCEGMVLLATGRFIGEGFDDPRLDTLLLAMPVSWRGTIAQYAGRLHRLHEGKREVRVLDYADLDVPMLARMFDRRCTTYEALGYSILLPASAMPGWPAKAPLPVDPGWKRDYAGSVQRLLRDGVDAQLASAFVHAAQPPEPDGSGADRARSAAEAFLWRRLESLPTTRGRFRLNVALPVPFDGCGQMEVDLLCADCRVAVEIDGPQHMADAAAWRRDRRKDALLQEHGYFVLRFLAADVAMRLDPVLDAILRTLAHRARHEELRPPTTHDTGNPPLPHP